MKKTRISLLLMAILLTLALVFTSCGPDSEVGDYAPGAPDDYYEGDKEMAGGGSVSGDVLSADRKIIKTVNETVETKEYDSFIERLKTVVAEKGGYFASSRYSGNGYETSANRNASFEIRIPADRLGEFTETLGGMGSVTYFLEEANDVTASYVDVTSRIAVLEAEETALLDILSKSETVSDMLEIRTRLAQVQGDLASLRAQKDTYDTLVAYSTVNLNLREVDREKTVTDDTFFGDVGEQFSDSLYGVGQFFRGVGVFFLGNSPVLLLLAAIGVGVFFLVRYFVRRSRRKAEEWEASHAKKNAEQTENKKKDREQ